MIKLYQLIKSINHQKTNPFVSKHAEWNIKLKSPVESIKFNFKIMKNIVNDLKNQETLYLQNIASNKRALSDFLLDKRINPRPDLAGKEKLDKLECLNFTIACLPVKSENPLKTLNLEPDLAEIALLVHFESLAKTISKVFGKDAKFTLLHEVDAYGNLFNISPDKRKFFLNKLLKYYDIFFDNNLIQVVNWQHDLETVKDFNKIQKDEVNTIENELKCEGKITTQELLQIFPTVYMSIGTDFPKLSKKIYFVDKNRTIDSKIKSHALKAKAVSIKIMAFNRARKKINERETLFPGFIKGNLTPSRDSWIFWPIGDWNKLYPHHGVGVLNRNKNTVTVFYNMNLRFADVSNNIIVV